MLVAVSALKREKNTNHHTPKQRFDPFFLLETNELSVALLTHHIQGGALVRGCEQTTRDLWTFSNRLAFLIPRLLILSVYRRIDRKPHSPSSLAATGILPYAAWSTRFPYDRVDSLTTAFFCFGKHKTTLFKPTTNSFL